MTENEDPLLTVDEAAAYLSRHPSFVRRSVGERTLRVHKLGRLLRFKVSDLDAFIDAGCVEPLR